MEMHEYLKLYREEMPEWLATYFPGDSVPLPVVLGVY